MIYFKSPVATTYAVVGRFSWTGGGESSPAIGPNGWIYALAGNALYIFRSLANFAPEDHPKHGLDQPSPPLQPSLSPGAPPATTHDHNRPAG